MDNEPEDGWLTLKGAAEVLGLSERTLRRRIKEGEIETRQMSTRFGLAYLVRVDSLASPVARAARDDGQAGQAQGSREILELIKLVDKLQESLLAKGEAGAMWQARAEILSHQFSNAQAQLEQAQLQLAEAQATIRILEAPKHQGTVVPTQSESPQEEPETAESREVVAEAGQEHQQPWWRRFWHLVSV